MVVPGRGARAARRARPAAREVAAAVLVRPGPGRAVRAGAHRVLPHVHAAGHEQDGGRKEDERTATDRTRATHALPNAATEEQDTGAGPGCAGEAC
ncbi:hypothetical protein GCM10027168_14840 [Streptomyces capparidis]